MHHHMLCVHTLLLDNRYLQFRFIHEPRDIIILTRDSIANFDCQSSFTSVNDVKVRTEWRKDGETLSVSTSNNIGATTASTTTQQQRM